MTARLLVGDVRKKIKEIPDGSVDFVCTSPPFLALRKYGDHADEMGSEATPAAFLDGLLELTAEFRRVLAPHGSIAVELGDSFSGSGGAGGDYGENGLREGQPVFSQRSGWHRSGVADGERKGQRYRQDGYVAASASPNAGTGWPLAKSLACIPHAYATSLAYGWNVLDRHAPDSPAGRWRVRNVIVWARPNPPVGALGDKVRPATSYITVGCVSGRRWFDLDAVRTDGSPNTKPVPIGYYAPAKLADPAHNNSHDGYSGMNPNGAPPLDWWEDDDPTGHATLILPTAPYPGAHYATWPPQLAKRLIEMMCPLRVCVECGEPSRRIVESERFVNGQRVTGSMTSHANDARFGQSERNSDPSNGYNTITERTTLGWTDCGHNNWRPGHVLDPFAGSGTTLATAVGCGRQATGIELYETNADLIAERCGMFLELT